MKKTVLVTLVILAMLFSMLPISSAIAAKVGTSALMIRNQTGAPIAISLTNTAGAKQQYTWAAGVYWKTVPAYIYTYVATTACGPRQGSVNLTRQATLYFTCKSGEQFVANRFVPAVPEPVVVHVITVIHN